MVSPFGPIGTESPGTVARAWGRGSKGLRQGFFGAQSKGRGARSPPGEAQEAGAGLEGWAGGEAAAEPGSQLICSRISTGEAARYLPHPLVSMVLGAWGAGAPG